MAQKKKNIKKPAQKKSVKKVTSKHSPVKASVSVNLKRPPQPVQPLGNRVLIRPFNKEDLEPKNAFGLILPDSNKKEKAEQGTVIAVGPGSWIEGKFVTPSLSVGDVVAFSKYGYDDITMDGEELYLIKEENVLAIINKK